MEELKARVKSFKNSKLASKIAPRKMYSPFRASLGKTVSHIRSYSKNQQKSEMKARLSPFRMGYTEKKQKNNLSISTETSNISKINEDDQNIIMTPTTVHEEHLHTQSIEKVLQDYFNKNSFVCTNIAPKVKHRYNHTVDLTPMRSETPEIPTKRVKLPVIIKKFKKARSPSPYDARSKSRCKRGKSPVRC